MARTKGGEISKASAKDKGKEKVTEESPSPPRQRKRIRSNALIIRDPEAEDPPQEAHDPPSRRARSIPLPQYTLINLDNYPPLRNEEHASIHANWERNRMVYLTSLFPDKVAFAKFEALDSVELLLTKVGLGYLFALRDPGTCEPLVAEFLASFVPTRVDKGKGKLAVTAWTFTMYGNHFAIPVKKIIDWFGFPKHGKKAVLSPEERDAFWSLLVQKDEYFVGNMSEQQIKRLEWKVIHRLIAENIVQRQETGRVTTEDLHFMFMTYHGLPIDMIGAFTTSFESYRTNPHAVALGGGSVVTLLAQFLNLHCHLSDVDAKALTIRKMRNLRMIRTDNSVIVSEEIHPKALHSYKRRVLEEGPPSGLWMGGDAPPEFEDEVREMEGEDIPPVPPAARAHPDSYDFSSLQAQMQEMLAAQRRFEDDLARMHSFQQSEAAWVRASFASLLERFPAPPQPPPAPSAPGPSTAPTGARHFSSSTSGTPDSVGFVVAPIMEEADDEELD